MKQFNDKQTAFYEATLLAKRLTEEGIEKNVQETIVTQAIGFDDAYQKVTLHRKDYAEAFIDILSIKITKYDELIDEEDPNKCAEKFYKVKVKVKSEVTEKYISRMYLVHTDTVKDAHAKITNLFRDSVADYEIATIEETKIIELV